MKSHLETDFNARFSLLNSQENSEVIIWSCDSSSDYENYVETKTKSKNIFRKRKRKTNKKLQNISNLDITITDATQERSIENNNKSPILKPKSSKTNYDSKEPTSPIIISNKANNVRSKSPILALRSRPSCSNISKKLFQTNVSIAPSTKKRCISPIINQSVDKSSFIMIKDEQLNISDENQDNHSHQCSNHDLPIKTNLNLIEKVKSYFKSNFSSDSLSQNSISEYDTPKNSSKTSEEIEIADLSQGIPLPIKKEHLSPIVSSSEEFAEKRHKVKYKKDGLAFRLNILLKKQHANVSLWQHEQYLAANSNFIMPKSTHATFRIKKVDFKFGCFLLLAINDKDEVFLILINNLFVKHKIEKDVILKLYEPYKILHFNDKYKLIVNACKFVCLPFSLN